MTKAATGSVIPEHIGIILDGNRRWAKENNLPQLEGHRVGANNISKIAEHAFSKGVKYMTVYVFSTENWKRSKEEIKYLMGLMPILFKKNIDNLVKDGVRVHWLGNYDNLSKKEIDLVESAVEKTKHLNKGHLCFCFNYGGRQELVDACKKILENGNSSKELTIEDIQSNLYAPEVPDVDLIIRTSGEQRISNFLLWRAAYSELLFIDKFWPSFTEADFDLALDEYAHRQRRFGC